MKYFLILLFVMGHGSAEQMIKSPHFSDCGLNEESIQLAQLIIESHDQKRSKLLCNKKLAQSALIKAKMMAQENDVSHKAGHTTPNQLLRSNGIKLPSNYPVLDNQVEAIMGGIKNAQESYDLFMSSPPHKTHLLGEDDFFLKQDQIGVAMHKDLNSAHMYYWVIYITNIKSTTD